MRTLTLNLTVPTTLDGNGNGQAQAGPSSPGEVWYPNGVYVATEQTVIVNQAQCRIYIGPAPTPPNLTDGTNSGSSGDTTETVAGKSIRAGQQVFAVWTAGDAGVPAFMVISGTRTVP